MQQMLQVWRCHIECHKSHHEGEQQQQQRKEHKTALIYKHLCTTKTPTATTTTTKATNTIANVTCRTCASSKRIYAKDIINIVATKPYNFIYNNSKRNKSNNKRNRVKIIIIKQHLKSCVSMLHLRLFDGTLAAYAAAASSSSSAAARSGSFNASLAASMANATTLNDDGLPLNLTYFTPALTHALLAPTTTIATATTTTISTSANDFSIGASISHEGMQEHAANAAAATAALAADAAASVVMSVAAATTANSTHAGGGGGGAISTAATAAAAGTVDGVVSAFPGDEDDLNSFYFYEAEQFTVLWILFTVIVLGNSAVLFVMFINKNRKSRMNYFIKQLALADLCVGLLNVLTDIIWRITISWRAGNIACKVIRFSQVCVTYSSTYVLVAMSIDRYDAITHPMNFSKSWKRARHLVAGAWITSALFSLPILVLYEEKLIQGQTQCWIELGSPMAWQIYMSLVSATLFVLPALIISACYAIIVKTIWAKGSIFVPTERPGYGNPPTRRASSRGIIPRAKVKTVKMTFTIVIVFILCWSPYIIFDLLQVFGQIPQTQTNIAIATFIQSLAPLNSAANPLIYCLFSSQVFRTLSRFPPFKWFTCCCKSYRNNSTQNRCHTVGRRLHNSCDSMRTLTTSLTVSRRSNKATARVVICERPKAAPAMSEV